MAHKGEAQIFLQNLHLKSVGGPFTGLYQNTEKNLMLLITGENFYNSLSKVSYLLGLHHKDSPNPIHRLINLGIAGFLDNENPFEEFNIMKVRTSYYERDVQSMEFKSFSCSSFDLEISECDLVTSYTRVKTSDHKKYLSHFAHTVDREFYGQALAAHNFNIPFHSFKLLSDVATDIHCESIYKKAPLYSQKLFDFFINKISPKLEQKFECKKEERKQNQDDYDWLLEKLGDRFYFTLSQKRDLIALIKKTQIKFSYSIQDIYKKIPLRDIFILSEKPKECTKNLLKVLHSWVSPQKDLINQKIEKMMIPLKKSGSEISRDSTLEQTDFTIKKKIRSNTDYELFKKSLQQFSFKDYEHFINGDGE